MVCNGFIFVATLVVLAFMQQVSSVTVLAFTWIKLVLQQSKRLCKNTVKRVCTCKEGSVFLTIHYCYTVLVPR